MLAERDGVQFYSMAAKQAEDPGAITLFEKLAGEEKRHFGALQTQYQSVLNTGTWDSNTAWETPWSPDKAGRIFSDDFQQRIQGRHLEMAALSIGILLEKQSFEFYSQQAKITPDAGVKEFFRELALWEDGHYQMLFERTKHSKRTTGVRIDLLRCIESVSQPLSNVRLQSQVPISSILPQRALRALRSHTEISMVSSAFFASSAVIVVALPVEASVLWEEKRFLQYPVLSDRSAL